MYTGSAGILDPLFLQWGSYCWALDLGILQAVVKEKLIVLIISDSFDQLL